ncbi:MAG: DEAD/DEAH box helicase [Lentisphaerae bacterium]|nr:DEAD/DEAH box helicase [Lentisphaerota bacterium]
MKQLLKKLARHVFRRKQTDPKHTVPAATREPARSHAPRKPDHPASPARPASTPATHAVHSPRPAHAAPRSEAVPKPRAEPWTVDQFPVPPKEGVTRFHDLELPIELMHAVADLEFKYCTPIQAQVLGPSIHGRHVMGRAQTGTGKTAAFLIAIFTRFLRHPGAASRPPGTPRALVIAPTRELVIQIAQDAKDLSKHTNLKCVAVYGGMDFDKQARALQSGPIDLIAATPGRLLDFARRGTLDLQHVEALVIDEADRMLDMGFIPDVKTIVRRLPPKHQRQTLFFTATLTDDVRRLAAQWTDDPVVAEVEPEQVAVKTVKQLVYAVASHDKFTLLYNLLQQPELKRVLIFGNRRDSTMDLADYLQRYGIPCGLLSGAIDQKKRLRILDEFKGGTMRVLVATDVAGRGLHIDEISHVINYDFPYEAEDYVHRIGRTGRAGAAGTAISFACEDESFIIPDIEKYIGETLPCRQPEEHLLVKLPPAPGGDRPRPDAERRAPYHGQGPSHGGRPSSRGGGRRPGPRRPGGPRRPRG